MEEIKSRTGNILTQYLGLGRQELEKELANELGAVLKDTLEGLKDLQHFLDAVEKLAVTSVFVFKEMNLESVQLWIYIARSICSLLISFKRDDTAFFVPKLENVDVLHVQLKRYIDLAKELCSKMNHPLLKLTEGYLNISGFRQNVTDHLSQLTEIRVDESFRMSFLFHEEGQEFIDTYSECRSRMFLFLADLEETAVQLDKMKMGSSISTVAGSSVGAVGSVLSIAGLALAPVTAGLSLGCTVMGVGLGVTSGVNSLVTGITEMAVNKHHGENAKNIFQMFMEDVQKVHDCLDQAASSQHPVPNLDEGNIAFKTGKIFCHVGSVGNSIDDLVEGASAIQILKSEEVVRNAVSMGLQEANAAHSIPKLAVDLPDIGQLAKGTPLAMSSAARFRFIGANVLFIGLDIVSIYKGSESLAKGETSEASQLIRSRSALWLSEMQAWDKIYECLCEGKEMFQTNLEILQQPLTVME
ncbi:hypothetical protein MHYP_G00146410 [Metynnis hypsauchen]